MTPLEMIAEWRKGCSCGGPAYDRMMGKPPGTTSPWECQQCTEGLIDAIQSWHRRQAMPAGGSPETNTQKPY